MIQTDAFLEIGNQHKTCQDYIIKGYNPDPFIILSDGCSSSQDTDMGARILCHLAKQYLKYKGDLHTIDYKKLGNWVIHNAEMAARQLGLKVSCLDATLIIAYYLDGRIYVRMYGDGIIAIKRDDFIEVFNIDFTSNAPYYLSYLIDDHRHELFHNMKQDLIITNYNSNTDSSKTTYAYDYPINLNWNIADLDGLFIASDGLSSFIVENPNERRSIEVMEVLPDFMAFKNTKGEYLKRRLNKALKGLYNMGINHFDDLSVGSFISI